MIPYAEKIKNFLLDALFPPICLNCQKTLDKSNINEQNKFICDKCLSLIQINNTLFCPICRARLPENKKICHLDSKYLLAPAGNYDNEILKNLIHYFKYKNFKNLSPLLGELILSYIKNSRFQILDSKFLIVPIPLHKKRERMRGFNQSKLLANYIAKKLNLESIDVLERIKNNKPQAYLKDSEERIKNMSGCFQIKNSNSVNSKNILLIDDVFTSGATINEAVKILKENGAKKIIALVIAKT